MRPTTPQERVRRNDLVRELLAMNLDPEHFVIFGSAPLLAHGLRAEVHDLDVVARGEVWRQVSAEGAPAHGTISGDPVRLFAGGKLQFSANWISREWDTDTLIDNAEIIAGLRFAPLVDVLCYKQTLCRPKDAEDIAAIEAYLGTTEPHPLALG